MKPRMLVAISAGMLLVSGCSATPEPETTPTATASVEDQFLEEMRATEAFFGFPDDQLIRVGNSTCEALRDGSTFDDLVRILAINDYTKDQASAIIFASSKAFCPEQER